MSKRDSRVSSTGQAGSKDADAIRKAARGKKQRRGDDQNRFIDELKMTADVISQLWNENVRAKLVNIIELINESTRRQGVESLPIMDPLQLPTIAELTSWFEQLERVERDIEGLLELKNEQPKYIQRAWMEEIEKNKKLAEKEIEKLQANQRELAALKENFLRQRKEAIRELFKIQAELVKPNDLETRARLRREVVAYREAERKADLEDNGVTQAIIKNAEALQNAHDILRQNTRSLENQCRDEVDELLEPVDIALELLTEVRTTKDIVWREVEEAQLTLLLADLDVSEE